MSRHDHRQFEQALAGIDRAILPNLSRLLDSVLESAALARPGHDAEAHAAGLRNTARQLDRLVALVGAVAQRPTISA
jgi:hypothetical protein